VQTNISFDRNEFPEQSVRWTGCDKVALLFDGHLSTERQSQVRQDDKEADRVALYTGHDRSLYSPIDRRTFRTAEP